MAHLTRLFLASLSLMVLAVAILADEPKYDTPENTVKTFLDAMSKQDNAAMLKCLIESERESCKDEFSGEPIEWLTISAKIKSTSTKGKSATVTCEISMSFGANPDVSLLMLVLTLEKEQWRICWKDSVRATCIEFPEKRRRQHSAMARYILVAVKDRARLFAFKQNRTPTLISELGFTEQDLAEPYWVMKDAMRISKDGKSAIAEIESREYDDLVLIRFGIVFEEKESKLLGVEDKSSIEERVKEVERLLGIVRDDIEARYEAEKGVIPGEVVKEGGSLTSFDLVSDHWVVRNEITSKGTLITLTADSLTECKIATLEFDATKGGGEVKFADAYTNADLTKQEKVRIEMIEICKALDTYKLETGDYPDSLDAIADTFGGKLPVDPYSKQTFSYERGLSDKSEYISLTCLGRDGKIGGRWMPDKDFVIRIEHPTKPEDEGDKGDGQDGSKGRFR